MNDFAALVKQYQAAVCATAYAVLRDRARSEEIAQDAFLIAWRKLPTMSPPPPLPAWICGIARNLARNVSRKRRETSMTDDITKPIDPTTPLDTALSREHADLANRALAMLSDVDRELVVLYYRCDESIVDVATALAIPEVTARKRLQRTRQRLRSALAAVEAMLRTTRPDPAFTTACVAALAAGRIPDAAAAATATSSSGYAVGRHSDRWPGPDRRGTCGLRVVVVVAVVTVVTVRAVVATVCTVDASIAAARDTGPARCYGRAWWRLPRSNLGR